MVTANAGWLASPPRGYVKLIAQRGMMQQPAGIGDAGGACPATRIEPPVHDFIENTVTGMQQADRLGANMVQVDVAPTADGRFVLFRDSTLDCRTNGKGAVNKANLADLQELDAGYGYTADSGKSFPLRYNQMGRIPALEAALAGLPGTPILFNIANLDPAQGQELARALKAARRDVERLGDGFTAAEPVLAPLRKAFPKAWAYSPESARECASRYLAMGWLTMVPDACKGGAIFIPIDRKWAFPGWPDRLLNRMAKANVRVVLTAPEGPGPTGLDLPEQLAEIPPSYTGYVLIEDIWTMGPVFHPEANRRGPDAQNALVTALEARRRARGLPEPR